MDTPLHPDAKRYQTAREIRGLYEEIGMDLSQMSNAFRVCGERVLIAQYAMISLQKPLSLITLTGV